MTAIAAGFFSLTGAPEAGDDGAYLRWHLLDHQPEQHTIAALRASTRWTADDACVAARLATSAALDPVRHAVQYLFAEPVEDALHEFVALAARLRGEGRMSQRATSHLLGAFAHVHTASAPGAQVTPAAIAFRPHRGVVLLVESGGGPDELADGAGALLEVAGVAGTMSFRSHDRLGIGAEQGRRFGLPAWDPGDRAVTVVYVDGDLLATTERLEPVLRRRWAPGILTPELAAPFRSMVSYEAWPAG